VRSPELTPQEHRRLDDATVALLRRTAHDGDRRTHLRDCRQCAAPFWVVRQHPGQRFCSERCRYAWRNRHRRPSTPDTRDQQTIRRLEDTAHGGDPRTYLRDCPGCGRPFWCRPPGTRRHCSQLCRQHACTRRHAHPEEDR